MSKIGLNKVLSSFRRGKRPLMRRLVKNSTKFFKDNFKKQYFVDRPQTRQWAKLKQPRSGPKKVLVKTGRMRRSIRGFISMTMLKTHGERYLLHHSSLNSPRLHAGPASSPSYFLSALIYISLGAFLKYLKRAGHSHPSESNSSE